MNSNTPLKPRPPPGQQGSTPFRSASASRFRSSLVPMNRAMPVSSSKPTKLMTNSSYGRDLFRTSTPQTARTTKFAPSLPADATRSTPSTRKFPQRNTHGGLSSVVSTEPFKMRIPSPDPELSGEALAKEVPADPNRPGTIYADQFLAHKCPPNFDDLQRRQFFCVLDLRRLKYAADEIFAKKDWKLNIMNFAKEYEKSRGLIMLRYGLYEFKNVKPSEEVLKRWRAAHGLPEPGPQAENSAAGASVSSSGRRHGGSNATSMKRKADEDLAPKDNALMASTANQNKRRNVATERPDVAFNDPAPFKKSKRKLDETDEPNENQPGKMHKATPTPAKSKFESILDKSQSGSTSPVKQPPLTSFGSQKSSGSQIVNPPNKPIPPATATNGFKPLPADIAKNGSRSVFAADKLEFGPAKSGTNIFSYLSESSANSSGNENGNADADDGDTTSDESGEEEVASQEAPPTTQSSLADSASTTTPPTQGSLASFTVDKPSTTSSRFGDLASKGGLFDRVRMGSDGQPLRATTDVEKQGVPAPTKPAAEKEESKTPAKRPGDFTFNAATTPIAFGVPTSNTTTAPATVPVASFGGFGKLADSAAKPSLASLFGGSAQASPAFPPAALSAASLFDNSTKSPEQQKSVSDIAPTSTNIAPTSTNIASTSTDVTPQIEAKEAPSALQEHASIFNSSTANLAKSAFETSVPEAQSQENKGTGSKAIFANGWKNPTSNPFGGSSSTVPFGGNNANANGSIFDTPGKQPSAGYTFGSSKPDSTSEMNKISNESSQETTTPSAAASRPIKPLPKNFGKRSSTWTSMSNPGNGNAALAKKEEKSEAATTQPSNTFNSTPFNTAPTFTFGGSATAPAPNNTQPPSAPPVIFGAGVNFAQSNGAESTQSVSQFGSSTPVAGPTSSFDFNNQGSSSTGFTFTAGGNGQSFNNPFASSQAQPSTSIFGGNSALPGPPSNINFGFGQQPPSTPRTQGNPVFAGQSKGGNGVPSFNFTQATPPQNNANPFASKPSFGTLGNTGSLLQAGGDTSTGATSPFPAPSSIATTPVNGTPEPQSQNENGEEASQAQASFTEGGPGEEDDVILHEVRAKAIKYVPVVKGSDEDEENKSPWTTQGVGPLRVLKNKTTGNVRILVRAEPRGHVAMNKALLSDVDYKAKDKTITFVASNDSGSGLETWVLQVKKPDIAQQLAGVLETNKSANKK